MSLNSITALYQETPQERCYPEPWNLRIYRHSASVKHDFYHSLALFRAGAFDNSKQRCQLKGFKFTPDALRPTQNWDRHQIAVDEELQLPIERFGAHLDQGRISEANLSITDVKPATSYDPALEEYMTRHKEQFFLRNIARVERYDDEIIEWGKHEIRNRDWAEILEKVRRERYEPPELLTEWNLYLLQEIYADHRKLLFGLEWELEFGIEDMSELKELREHKKARMLGKV